MSLRTAGCMRVLESETGQESVHLRLSPEGFLSALVGILRSQRQVVL